MKPDFQTVERFTWVGWTSGSCSKVGVSEHHPGFINPIGLQFFGGVEGWILIFLILEDQLRFRHSRGVTVIFFYYSTERSQSPCASSVIEATGVGRPREITSLLVHELV